MRKIFSFLFLICCVLTAIAQESDPVIMTVAGKPVLRSEFEYQYKKNNTDEVIDKMTAREYADLYAVYRMKTLAAEEAGLDTLKSFLEEFRKYRDMQIRPLLITDNDVEGECRQFYQNMLSSLGGKNLLLVSHIFQLLPQRADASVQAEKKARIDSLYAALKAGADFAELARTYSDDRGSAENGGQLPWLGPGQTVKEFEDVVYSLKKGEISEPFLSTVGYHIATLLDERPLEPYDTLRPRILQYLESRGIRESLARQNLDSIVKTSGQGVTIEDILDRETERLCAQNAELRYLVNEYHDGLLVFEICSRNVWEPAKTDTASLETYFKNNKKNYSWDVPHYRGMAFYCKEKSLVKSVKKILKKTPESGWLKAIREAFNKETVQVKMEKRLFVKGENPTIDNLVFKVKGAAKKQEGFPYVGVYGSVLKSGPEKWTDVSTQVVDDYQKQKMQEFEQELKLRYPVVINEEVVSTVTSH